VSGGREAVTAGDLLTLPELRALRRLSTWRGAALVVHAWAVIAGAMLLYAAWPSSLTLLVAVVVIGARQLGLAILMHEAAHWLLFRGQWANNRIGAWLCAYPVLGDLPRYRRRHHLHHRHTQQADDPDLTLAALVAPRAFWLGVLRDLTGVTAAARLLAWRPWRADASPSWRRLRGPLATNAALLAGLAALGHWSLYVWLWVLPLATWYQLLTRIRNAAEHVPVGDDDHPLRHTRTTGAGPLARALLAPYWMNYHLEHHLLVFVPCWRLPDAHALLLAKGHGPSMALASDYREAIRRAMTSEVVA
jgi:fatty acid desaturase